MLKYKCLVVFLALLFLFSFNIGFSQPCNGPDCGGDPDVPLTGIEWLIGAGVLWGFRNTVKKRENR